MHAGNNRGLMTMLKNPPLERGIPGEAVGDKAYAFSRLYEKTSPSKPQGQRGTAVAIPVEERVRVSGAIAKEHQLLI